MALITANQIRDFLKQPDIAEVNAEFTLLYGMAIADIETALGRAIDSAGGTRTFGTAVGMPVIPSLRFGTPSPGSTTVTESARPALSTLDDYAARYMALASGWILDVVVDRWKHRVASVSSESGTGGSVTYEQGWLPTRVAQSIRAVQRELQGR
jgi:hypothetical protein